MNKICLGCGCKLQNVDSSLPGYTTNLKNKYCRRCFRLKNYGEKNLNESVDEESILNKVNHKNGIAFFLMDFLNINSETISIFNKIKIPKVLIISKSDILRAEMNPEKIKIWLKKTYKLNNDILFISNNVHFKSNNILKYMSERNIQTAYIMGITNAGKSTFINSLLKDYGYKEKILATNKPNTTLDFIKIKLDDFILYDTPGFTYENSNKYLSNDKIKPISYQIKANTTLIIDNYKLFFNKPNKVIFYGNSSIIRNYKILEKDFCLNIPNNSDIVLPGIGFINIKDSCNVYANIKNLEIRTNISEVNYE